MSGNSPGKIVLQDRDRMLLAALSVLRVVDREQAQRIGPFGSIRRANTRLLQLTQAGLLRRCFFGTEAGGRRALYMLSARGASVIPSSPFPILQRRTDELLVADGFIQHQLLVNSVWIAVHRPVVNAQAMQVYRWKAFTNALSPAVPLIPDGYFEVQSNDADGFFVELDRGTEPQKTWQKKTELYLKLALSGAFKELFKQSRFRVLVVTTSARRADSIRRTVLKQTAKIFRFATIQDINSEGLWAPIWTMPDGTPRTSLLGGSHAFLQSV